jgi:alkylation response protein AidB-like acyl-CoA dehydrogenase
MATAADHIVAETAVRIFADLADPQTVNVAPDFRWKEALWRALTEAGLPLAWVAEAQGGAGVSIAEGFEIIGAAGRFALSVPLAETLLAGWLLERGGIKSPAGVMTVAPVRGRDRIALNADGTLSGSARSIPFADEAAHLAILAIGLAGPTIALVNAADCDIGEGRNLAGEPANTVRLDRVKPVADARAPDGFDAITLLLMGATVRSVEIAGALESVLSMSVRYANERVAFERPIGKFQAVQQNLARLAGETAAALAAAGSAADTIAHAKMFDDTIMLEAASAKIRAGEAAAEGSAIAHQVHGAIGFTDEHVLHRFTLRMLAWRDDFDGESHWAATLGRMVARGGSQQFWPILASR